MTIDELHEILDDKSKKITIKEYKEILYQLKQDIQSEICKLAKEVIMSSKIKWYYGEVNGFQLALDLSEHIEDEIKNEQNKACDMFENSADNYCRSWYIYNYALDFALERIKYLENCVKENTKICVDTETDKDWLIRNGAEIFEEKVYKRR